MKNTGYHKSSNEGLQLKTDRRAYERYPAKLEARLFFGNLIYTGMITDLSLKGMFISTKVGFPVNSEFMMIVLVNERAMKIPVKVRRRVNGEGHYSAGMSGIGVELLGAPQNYAQFVDSRSFS